MAIDVICPGCHKRFQVSEKFAGKKGPCPKCKAEITVPALKDQVVVHAPEVSGPKDSKGRSVLKPIARSEAKVTPLRIAGIVVAAAGVLIIAAVLRSTGGATPIILGLGAVLLAPPLAAAGYAFLRDDELDPYRGWALWIRAIVCGLVYAILWALYVWIPPLLFVEERQLFQLLFIVPPLVLAGAFAAFASLDLDFGMGAVHYGLYLLVTVTLCLIMGVNVFFLPVT